jgi:electron transport complex protein RnfB
VAHRIVETCTGCTACTNRCPTEAISGVRKAVHAIDPERCVDCGACGVVCPSEAILDPYGALAVMLKKSQRPRAFVDALACVGCEKCADRCPFGCLSLERGVDPDAPHFGIVRVDDPRCVGCRECEDACPWEAISVHRRDRVPPPLAPPSPAPAVAA